MSEIEARVKGAEIPASIRRDERKTNVRLMEVGAEDERKAIIRIVRKYLLYITGRYAICWTNCRGEDHERNRTAVRVPIDAVSALR